MKDKTAIAYSKEQVIDLLKEHIDGTTKRRITIFAGHMPLLYFDNGPKNRKVIAGVYRWGEFTTHTFDIGCQVHKYASEKGKDSSILLCVDDDAELPRRLSTNLADMRRKDYNWAQRPRRRFFRQGNIPEEIEKILTSYNLDDSCLVRQTIDRGISTPLVSERVVKLRALKKGILDPTECGIGYRGLIKDEELFGDLESTALISMTPGQCKGSICGVINTLPGLESSHIFYPRDEILGGYLSGITPSTSQGNPSKMEDLYEHGLIRFERRIN